MNNFYTLIHKVSFWMLLVFVSSFVIRVILMLDPNKRVYNHTPGPCRVLTDQFNGSSGLEYVPSLNAVLFTYGMGKASFAWEKSGIGLYEVHKDEKTQNKHVIKKMNLDLKNFDKSKFAPGGISSYTTQGRTHIYVVNTHPSKRCIVFFMLVKNTLVLQKTLCDVGFTSLHDLVAVGPDKFFFTNRVYFNNPFLQLFEFIMQSNTGTLYFYDGHTASVAIPSLPSPGPLAYDSKRRKLYVGSMINEVIKVYDVKNDFSLSHKVDIFLLSTPVGLFVDEKLGDIWASCYPVLYQAYLHHQNFEDKNIRGPSQVLRVRMQEDGISWVITEPYANDGATISSGSAVVFAEDQMVVGSAYGRLLHCDVLNPQIT